MQRALLANGKWESIIPSHPQSTLLQKVTHAGKTSFHFGKIDTCLFSSREFSILPRLPPPPTELDGGSFSLRWIPCRCGGCSSWFCKINTPLFPFRETLPMHDWDWTGCGIRKENSRMGNGTHQYLPQSERGVEKKMRLLLMRSSHHTKLKIIVSSPQFHHHHQHTCKYQLQLSHPIQSQWDFD